MRTSFVPAILFAACFPRLAADPFINLDFDLANANTLNVIYISDPYIIGQGPIEGLLPGWSLKLGDRTWDFINYNAGALDLGIATIASRDAYERGYLDLFFPNGFQGDYALALSVDTDDPFVLTQRGDIPLDAQLFNLDANFSLNTPVEAQINGTPVADGDDISIFAGQNVELQLRAYQKNPPGFFDGIVTINSVAFVVPEPGTVSISVVGGTLLGFWLWKRRRYGR